MKLCGKNKNKCYIRIDKTGMDLLSLGEVVGGEFLKKIEKMRFFELTKE